MNYKTVDIYESDVYKMLRKYIIGYCNYVIDYASNSLPKFAFFGNRLKTRQYYQAKIDVCQNILGEILANVNNIHELYNMLKMFDAPSNSIQFMKTIHLAKKFTRDYITLLDNKDRIIDYGYQNTLYVFKVVLPNNTIKDIIFDITNVVETIDEPYFKFNAMTIDRNTEFTFGITRYEQYQQKENEDEKLN